MAPKDEPDQDVPARSETRRNQALLSEYAEVVGNFRLLTDIRFKLLAVLPIAAGAATAVLSVGGGRDGTAEVRALALSLFGLLVTVALATYNDRNDQLYDRLVGRAASIEWQLGLHDGAFANRPPSWFAVRLPVVRWKWSVDHRTPVAWIYGASVALWLFGAGAAALQLLWGDSAAPRGALTAVLLPAVAVPLLTVRGIREQRRAKEKEMRSAAADATSRVLGPTSDDLAQDDEFLKICERLGGVELEDARVRARFYTDLSRDESRQFLPEKPEELVAAHFVALITDLPAEWIDDCVRERRKALPKKGEAELEALPTDELCRRARRLALRRLDVGFLWTLRRSIPAAEAAACTSKRPRRVSAARHRAPDDFREAGMPRFSEALRRRCLEYLAKHAPKPQR